MGVRLSCEETFTNIEATHTIDFWQEIRIQVAFMQLLNVKGVLTLCCADCYCVAKWKEVVEGRGKEIVRVSVSKNKAMDFSNSDNSGSEIYQVQVSSGLHF